MSNKSHIFGYLLGLLIFVIGIPALMWLVSGRPWPYAPDSALLSIVSLILAVCGLTLSIYSIVYMRIVKPSGWHLRNLSMRRKAQTGLHGSTSTSEDDASIRDAAN